MKIPLHIAEKLLQLSQGATIPSGAAKHAFIEELISERIIEQSGRIQKKLTIFDSKTLFLYLQNKHGISDLKKYIEVYQKVNIQIKNQI